jgi:hypothetical protein
VSGQETHSQASTIDFKSVQDQRQKSGYTWIVGPTNDVSMLKWTNAFIHTLYYTPRGSIPKEEGPLISVGSTDALPCRPMAYLHQTTLLWTHARRQGLEPRGALV